MVNSYKKYILKMYVNDMSWNGEEEVILVSFFNNDIKDEVIKSFLEVNCENKKLIFLKWTKF